MKSQVKLHSLKNINTTELNGILSYKPIFIISSIFGIMPILKQGKVYKFRSTSLCILLALILIATYILDFINRINDLYKKLWHPSVVVIDVLKGFFLMTLQLYSTVGIGYGKRKELQIIFDNFVNFDTLLASKSVVVNISSTKTYLILVLVNLFVIVVNILDIKFWSLETHTLNYIYRVFDHILFYVLMLECLGITVLSLCFKERFKYVNKSLLNIINTLTENEVDIFELPCKKQEPISVTLNKVKHLCNCFFCLCKMVNFFNDIFGWQMLFITASITTSLLTVFNVSIARYFYYLRLENSVSPDLYFLCFMWASVFLVSD